MESSVSYFVEITPEAENFFLDVLSYLYQAHTLESADEKSLEILELGQSLSQNPYRGRIVDELKYLHKEHRYLIYKLTKQKGVKIIYFVSEGRKTVYITDFSPSKMHPERIKNRSE